MANHKSMHGMSKAKGCQHLQLGRFCRLFPKLPSWSREYAGGKSDLPQCEAEEIAALIGGAGGLMHDAGGGSGDSSLPAAYIFFAQFIDHDVTLDTATRLHGKPVEEVSELPNLRSASLDLDCVYGFGPEASPHLYDSNQPGRLLLGPGGNDVPRSTDGTALIGDPRNDENLFVSQLQLLFLKFHNRRMIGRTFEQARDDVRYHYQWLVLYDFLRRVCDPTVYDAALPLLEKGDGSLPLFKKHMLDEHGALCMPVEFSVAAYRFGHTLVRSQFAANERFPVVDLFDERFGTEGFSAVPEELVVQWRFLLDVASRNDFVKAKAFDHLLSDELIRMPDPVVGRFATENERSLAFRNILRSYVLGLPSGQAVEKVLCCYPKSKGNKKNRLDPLVFSKDTIAGWDCLPGAVQKKLKKHTPLFFYLMLEAAQRGKGQHLGPVGSAILLEVFGMMLTHCEDSILSKKDWEPDPDIYVSDDDELVWSEEGGVEFDTRRSFTLADLVRYVEG